ncbi:MAG: OmpA family protein [Bacteroidia bacterium]|nr:OmpA family protein [Bacteroidia bacterium]
MRNLVVILAIVLAGWTGGGTWYWVCQVRGLCAASEQPAPVPPVATQPDVHAFVITYRSAIWASRPDNVRFPHSSGQPRIPGSVSGALDSLAAYLKAHPDQDVEITGSFASSETNTSESNNLGLARAQAISAYLTARGVPDDRILRSFDQVNTVPADSLIGGVSLRILDRPVPPAPNVPEPQPPTVADLYFETGSANIIMSDSLRAQISTVIQYLRAHPKKKLFLVGHTDNVGADAANLTLGKQRAALVGSFFQEFGAEPRQMSISSAGESQPIASNDTEAGKAQNRRVEILIR